MCVCVCGGGGGGVRMCTDILIRIFHLYRRLMLAKGGDELYIYVWGWGVSVCVLW